MAYKVCLLDSDPAYQRALMEYLNLRATIPIQLYVFSNPAVYAAFREREKPELILVGDCYADWKDAEDCPVLVLTTNREYIGRTQYFFRYQSVEHLVETMLQMIGANQPCVTETGMFYAVYSPLGRCGKTTFAKKLCERIGNSLYVNWEGISECLDEKGIGSWMLYCMKSRNEECLEYLQANAVASLPPPECFQDIRQIEIEDLRWFREAIQRRGQYAGVVFDIGGMALASYAVFGAFDRILIPTLRDTVSQKKQKVFEQMLCQEYEKTENLQYVQLEGQDVDQIADMYVR